MTQETGPIYGTPLITSLQVSNDGWIQKMPSRADLQWCQDAMSYRVAAGYEVLLAHYHKVCEERERLRQQVRDFVVDNAVRKMETGL